MAASWKEGCVTGSCSRGKMKKETKPKEDAKKCYACGGTPEFRDIANGEVVDVCKTCIKSSLNESSSKRVVETQPGPELD